MITFFNRKELLLTSMKECAKIREVLRCNGIDSIVRAINHQSPVMGVVTRDVVNKKIYMIYVKRSDYDKARGLVNTYL